MHKLNIQSLDTNAIKHMLELFFFCSSEVLELHDFQCTRYFFCFSSLKHDEGFVFVSPECTEESGVSPKRNEVGGSRMPFPFRPITTFVCGTKRALNMAISFNECRNKHERHSLPFNGMKNQ